jgi:hypothetical protein
VSVVIDASITLSWYFEDERTPAFLLFGLGLEH